MRHKKRVFVTSFFLSNLIPPVFRGKTIFFRKKTVNVWTFTYPATL
ncbi:hypothetical protein LEP1GSC074_3541 [Leptospira noguchii str. Hook]|uniref:Uncharacterized protein n=1 Tax=Leptospira noguchii serovar Autumnalis str. ZUN142 TaxID=1085540 RepID=M6UEP8_9LEPT|nr:hypothetical protein LEP1GSC041_2103 [Leptospira noguchii str. 2006001870]EMO27398.1 hypothetical protein LEP1GSC170_3723 [Leptospira interrogans serovar Bataviae str. HAI135]EMO41316.1 hypothetical protein LEP1GSC186_3586 [Leptospira noguchii serovar Autumnalis str. ZUN142]EMS83902.1 hypothetical protein LEP1GSC074_3541 [Leptospira noguchii str. Hook]